MSLSSVASSPQATTPETITPAETTWARQNSAPGRVRSSVLTFMRAWLGLLPKAAAPAGKPGNLRHEIELRAQLAVGEAQAFSEQRYDSLRHTLERRSQLTVAEAHAISEQRQIALRQEIERQFQHWAAEANARTDRLLDVLRHEVAHRVQLAVAEAHARGEQRTVALRHEIEHRAQLAVAEAHARAEQRAAGLRHEVERRAQLAAARANASLLNGVDAGVAMQVSLEELVQHIYRGVLKRDAEPRGLEIYGQALRDGLPLSDVIAELISTPEFRSKLAHRPNDGAAEAGELRRLAAAMERAVLTLAIGAAGQRGAESPDTGQVPIISVQPKPATP